MQLCTFSKSEIHDDKILATCPLDLTAAEARAGKGCPCKKRLYHIPPADLRVLSCTFPQTWRGDPIRDPEALAKSLKIDRTVNQRERSFAQMTTTTAAPEAAKDKGDPKKESESRALSRVSPGWMSLYNKMVDPIKFLGLVGQDIYDSKMFGCSNPAQGRMLALMFLTKGIDPFEWKPRNHVIGGNVTMASEAMLADLRTDCGGTHRIVSRTPEKAAIEITISKQKQLFEFTWAEARVEEYVYNKAANEGKIPKNLPDGSVNPAALKDNWSTPRRRMQMLWARVVSDAVGAMAPEVASGKLTPEEMGVTHEEAVLESAASFVQPTQPQPERSKDPGEIIEGDFEVSRESTDAAEAAATPTSETTAGSAAATEFRSKPESPPFEPTGPAADAEKPAQVLTGQAPAEAEQKKLLLLELKALKNELLTPEQYAKVIDSKGVKSAHDLDFAALAKLVSALRARKEKKVGTDALSQWAEGALKPKAEGGQAGN